MTIARRYEVHNEKVIKYFTSKYKEFVDDYLLIIDLENDENPWQKIINFLHCHEIKQDLNNNNNNNDIFNQFPNANKAPDEQVSNIIPINMKFDWKNYQFEKKKQKVFDVAQRYYNQPYSMQYKYFESYRDANFVNLYQSLYKPLRLKSN